METETNQGKPCILVNGNKFRQSYKLKTGDVAWRCTMKECNVRLKTSISGKVMSQKGIHTHEEKVLDSTAVTLRVACKRRAINSGLERPSKIIRSAIEQQSESSGDITLKDIKNIRAVVCREKRKQHAPLPTSTWDTFATLDTLPLVSLQNEDFLMLCCEEDKASEWQPPSEAEHKILEARRERQNKISKLIGDYLLKGYKMLASACPECETILMRSRQGEDYCVACNELDSDGTKDDPVLSSTAAHRQVQEQQVKLEPLDDDSGLVMCNGVDAYSSLLPPADPSGDHHSQTHEASNGIVLPASTRIKPAARADKNKPRNTGAQYTCHATDVQCCRDDELNRETVAEATSSLYDRLDWATSQLKQTHSVDGSIQLCDLIRGCADAIVALRRVEHLND